MLGYICKYTPVEIFEAMGIETKRIEPEVTSFGQADLRMHPNICSFAKGVLEDVMAGDYDGLILTTCCDSIRRLYDVLKEQYPEKFIYILDVPRITKEAGITLYEQRIRAMIRACESYYGKTFEETKLAEILAAREGQCADFRQPEPGQRNAEHRHCRCQGRTAAEGHSGGTGRAHGL